MSIDLAHSLSLPDAPAATGVIILHGLTSDRRAGTDYARWIAERGIVGLALDLPGHGESPGDIDRLVREEYFEAVEAAVDHLRREHGIARVGLAGSSFGAYVAAMVAGRTEIAALAMRAPADYPDRGWDLSVPALLSDPEIWGGYLRGVEPTAAQAAVAAFDGPLLVVESELDEVIGHEVIAAYLEAAPDPAYRLMVGAPHSIGRHPEHHEAYGALLVDFFTEALA